MQMLQDKATLSVELLFLVSKINQHTLVQIEALKNPQGLSKTLPQKQKFQVQFFKKTNASDSLMVMQKRIAKKKNKKKKEKKKWD